tara:strand:+ start:2036 stop:2287 length:252 start_codon:yes stop_codon:yes gene_type:complete
MSKNKHRCKYWLLTKDDGTTVLVSNLKEWCQENDYDPRKIYHLKCCKMSNYKDLIHVSNLTQAQYQAHVISASKDQFSIEGCI